MRTRFTLSIWIFFVTGLVAPATVAHAAPTVITEFYNTTLAHYVLITDAAEVAAIENGAAGPGWQKTGKTLNANTAAEDAPGLVAVCRFYGSVFPGPNSHFFTADPDECAAVKTDPGWHYEGIAFYVALPFDGECGAGQRPVFRAYNNGFKPHLGINDGNHRFSVDQSSIQKLVDTGWNDEGVVFCAQAESPSVPVELTVASASLLLLPGTSRNVFVRIEPRGGFTGAVSLSASGLLPGVSYQFTPPTITTLASEAIEVVLGLTVAPSALATTGIDILTIHAATAGGGSAMAGVTHRIAVAGDPVAVRLAAIAAVEERCLQLFSQQLAPLAFAQAVATFMASRIEYEASGVDVDTQTAWGRFRDGHIHAVTNTWERAPSAMASVGRHSVPFKTGAEVPGATKARLIHSFGPNAGEQIPVNDMRGHLRAKGWTVRAGPSDSHVGTLKGTVGDGFFYFNTHGGSYDVPDPTVPGGKMYAIQSSTLVDDQYDQIFADDLRTLRLIHLTAGGETKYGITYRFVDRYMSFTNASVVLINACYSSTASDFVNAFIRKGAGVYLGWSHILDYFTVVKSAPYFVDRMLGANKHPDLESPPQRAFSYKLVLQDMTKKSLDYVGQSGARLQATEKTGLKYPPIFAPSIRFARVNEYDEELMLEGQFGEDKPAVTVGGSPRTVKSWSATKLVTDLPLTGSGSSGDVIVEVRGVKSNAKQLTEWSIPIIYSWMGVVGTAGWTFDGTGHLRFRADVGGYRDIPGERPKYDAIGGVPAKDSNIVVTASGSNSDSGCIATLSGSGTYVSPAAPPGSPTIISSGIGIDGNARTGILGMAFGAMPSPHIGRLSGPGCSGTFLIAAYMGQLQGFANVPTSQLNPSKTIVLSAANLTLGSDFSIQSGLRRDTSAGGTIEVFWPLAQAKTAPRDTIDAGK